MDSESQTENKMAHVIANVSHSTWKVTRLAFGYVVTLFAMSAVAEVMLVGKNLPPVKVVFFPYDRQVCLAMIILWVSLKIRKYLKGRPIGEHV